jgi:acyl-CoA synthetase (AMP-forming)/AMP-acid ligase II
VYPLDLEACARAAHPALAGGSGAAFALVDAAGERPALVHEAAGPPEAGWGPVLAAVRGAIAREHGVALAGLHLVRPGALPRTTSGKVRRQAAAEALAAGALAPLASG